MTRMEANMMLGKTLVLLGILFVVSGLNSAYVLAAGTSTALAAGFLADVAFGWILTIIQLAAGLMALATGWKMHRQKSARRR